MPRRPDIELDLTPLNSLVKKASASKIVAKTALSTGKFAAIGFGLFRDNEDSIWKLEAGDDGVEYIVKAEETSDSNKDKVVEACGDWCAICDETKENVTLSHRGAPVYKFASQDFGFEPKEAKDFAKYIVNRTKEAEFVEKIKRLSSE